VPNNSLRRTIAAAGLATLALSGSRAFAAEPEDEVPLDEIVVTATRSPGLIRDEPLRIEAVPAEEIEENLTLQPGNVSMLVKELPGVHVQSSAPGLGGASMQLRGLPSRNTLVLSDGLPLQGDEADAFGLLQIAPVDLDRAEVIKGAATALYGGSALGGVLNLISKPPTAESAFVANVTTRGGRDLVGFLSAPGDAWGATLMGSINDQARQDVDGDQWADIAGYRRYSMRPRAYWKNAEGDSLLLTLGAMDETRDGGTMPGAVLPDGEPLRLHRNTQRFDAGAISQWTVSDAMRLSGRYSLSSTRLDQEFDGQAASSRQTTAFIEEALNGEHAGHRWVAGLAWQHDTLSAPDTPGLDYTYDVPALFAQDTYAPFPWLSLAASGRIDAHSDYGTFFSPRVSALLRQPDEPWSLRASVGTGYTAPTPYFDEVAATWLGAMTPLRDLDAERATSAALDAKWAQGDWDVNVSVFTSEIRDALQVISLPDDKLQIVNAPGPRRAPGVEMLIGYRHGPLQALASWSAIDATEVDETGHRHDAYLVPRTTASIDAILESEQRGRVGFELDYTGPQALDDNPYRDESPGYWHLNFLVEARFGEIAVFVNAINVTDVRQTHYDPLLRGSPGPGGNPITDAWAPLEGRTFNIGVRGEL
jgi:iron complex outermembrane receptor protein